METQHRDDWEQLGRTDPMWAVLSDPAKRGRRWDRREFFATGEADVARLMSIAERLGVPSRRDAALDFGAGIGRVSRALAPRFGAVVGCDVSVTMVEQARANCADVPNVTFAVADGPALSDLQAASFDLVYSRWVLQHLPNESLVGDTLRELARLLRRGGLFAVQIPGRIPIRHRIQPRRRAYSLLRRVGVPPAILLDRLRLSPIRMTGIGQREARQLLEASGLAILEVHAEVIGGSSIDSFTFYATTSSAVRAGDADPAG